VNGGDILIAADHPAFAGHFPGMPVLPGVVLLDEALHAIGAALGIEPSTWCVGSAKFLSLVRPGDRLRLAHECRANGSIRFTLHCEDRLVASGLLQPRTDAP
jgi:3-hydroxymyristoyl/3-hydroxydecanoyl-(acyl carrier protein) dehydratase